MLVGIISDCGISVFSAVTVLVEDFSMNVFGKPWNHGIVMLIFFIYVDIIGVICGLSCIIAREFLIIA